MKICNCCKLSLDPLQFHKNPSNRDGLNTICKSCKKEHQRARRQKALQDPQKAEKLQARVKASRNKGKERATQRNREYRKENADKRREYNRTFVETNREWYLAYKRDWARKNKKGALYSARRRTAKLKATPPWVDRKAIDQIYEQCPPGYEVDHIHPLQGINFCGLHVPWNLQYLTIAENRRKKNRLPE